METLIPTMSMAAEGSRKMFPGPHLTWLVFEDNLIDLGTFTDKLMAYTGNYFGCGGDIHFYIRSNGFMLNSLNAAPKTSRAVRYNHNLA